MRPVDDDIVEKTLEIWRQQDAETWYENLMAKDMRFECTNRYTYRRALKQEHSTFIKGILIVTANTESCDDYVYQSVDLPKNERCGTCFFRKLYRGDNEDGRQLKDRVD